MIAKFECMELLLVDDSATGAERCAKTLKEYRLSGRVAPMNDGQEAVDFLFARGMFAGSARRRPPKIVLRDLRAPEVDGFAGSRRINARDRSRTLPVVVLVSSRDDRDRAGRFVGKTVGRSELPRLTTTPRSFLAGHRRAPRLARA